MKIINRLYRLIDLLGHAKKNGMIVGGGVTLAGRAGTSFGSEPYLIELKDNVRLSGGCTFFTHDGGIHAFRDLEEYSDVQKFGRICVEANSFIGYGVMILPNVTIGKRCVIGAGAVVTKDIPDHSVAVGVPAKVICSTFEYADRCMKEYQEIGYDINEIKLNRKNYLMNLFMNK